MHNQTRSILGITIHSKRAQSAFELASITGIMLVVFMIFMVILGNQAISEKKTQDRRVVENLANSIAEEIRLASNSENGYIRIFEIPSDLSGTNFSVTLLSDPIQANHSEITIKTLNYSYDIEVVEVVPNDIKGSLLKGSNTLIKKNGKICVNYPSC